MTTVLLILIAVVSYFIGSINTAILIGRLKGDDIRNHGSGTRGQRTLFVLTVRGAGAMVVLGDCLKAAVSCLLGILVSHITPLGTENVKLAIYAGARCRACHNFPLYFGFKGGKGILVSITALTFANGRLVWPF